MKTFIALSLALFAGLAHAQLLIPLQECITDRPDLPLPVPTKPPGVPPQLGGTCTLAVIETNAIGGAAAYWCPQPAPLPPHLSIDAVRWSEVTPAMLVDFAQLGLPGDNAERIRAMRAKYQTANVADMCDVWGPARLRINAAMPAPQVWVVPPNPSAADKSRPAYAVNADGTRGKADGKRAAAGSVCALAVRKIVEGSSTYGAYGPANSAASVALCQMKP